MAPLTKVCPHCARLNAATDARCANCARRLPADWELALERWRSRFFGGAPATALFAALSLALYVALVAGDVSARVSDRRALFWGALAGELGWREPWRHLSALFVHFNLLHIGFNLLALVSFGRGLEQALGSARFALLLLLSGVAGFLASDLWYLWFPQPYTTGGLSGGIFGLLGAEVGLRFAAADLGWKRAAISALGYAVAMALLPGQNINNAAHLGGLAAGGVLGWALARSGSSRRFDPFFRVLAALLLLATLAAIAQARLG